MVAVESGSVQVTLTVAGEMTFYALVHSDGTVNRFGSVDAHLTGPAPGIDLAPTLGMSEKPYFQTLLNALTPELVRLNGRHTTAVSENQCRLEVLVSVADRGLSIDYTFDSRATELPSPLRDFVLEVVEVTDDWLRTLPPRAP